MMSNSRKKFFLCSFFVVILFLVIYSFYIARFNNDIDIKFTIERVEHSLKDNKGNILSYIYYDKPVLTGIEDEIINKINSFFNNDCDAWLNFVDRTDVRIKSAYNVQKFQDLALENIDNSGSDVIKEQPFKYLVDTKLILLDNKYFSILQIYNFRTMGPQDTYYYGSTFDLETGELVPFDSICNFDAVSFKNEVVPLLTENIIKLNHNLSEKDIELFYSELDYQNENNYSDIKYNYCYDGENFYLINNETSFIHSGIIVKWNGKYNENSLFSLLIYEKSKQDANFIQKNIETENN